MKEYRVQDSAGRWLAMMEGEFVWTSRCSCDTFTLAELKCIDLGLGLRPENFCDNSQAQFDDIGWSDEYGFVYAIARRVK